MVFTEEKYLNLLIHNMISEAMISEEAEEDSKDEEAKKDGEEKEDAKDKDDKSDDKKSKEKEESKSNLKVIGAYVTGFISPSINDSWCRILKKTGKLPDESDKLALFNKNLKEDMILSEYRLCTINIKDDDKTYGIFFEPSSLKWMCDDDIEDDKFKEILNSDYWKKDVVPAIVRKLEETKEMLNKYVKAYITDGLLDVDEIKFELLEKRLNAPATVASIKATEFKSSVK